MHPPQEQVTDASLVNLSLLFGATTYLIHVVCHPSPFDILISAYKTTTILIDGKRVKLQLWDTSGQGNLLFLLK